MTRCAFKDAIFLSPAQVHRWPGDAGCAGGPHETCSPTRVPDVVGGRHRCLRQPRRTRVPRPTSSTARRPAPPRSSSRSGPAWSSSSRKPWVSMSSEHSRPTWCAAPSHRWAGEPEHRDPGQPRRRPTLDRLVRGALPRRGYLHHNFVVAVLNDLFGIQSRGGCSCAGPYGHRLLGIDLEPRVMSSSARSQPVARASSPAGSG